MHKIVTVVGARPQFIKAAAISRVLREKWRDGIREVIVHTGQHYDANMSSVFFDELGLPREDYNLAAGSASHAKQTADMLVGIEEVLLKERPDLLLLYGDTNSTVAGALSAAKLHIPIAHVEGGVRSRRKEYPEEVNRLVCDHLSTLIFCPTRDGMARLEEEGFRPDLPPPHDFNRPAVYHCGDIMYDNSMYFADKAAKSSNVLQRLHIENRAFALATVHRPHNTDDPAVLGGLLRTFSLLAEERDLVFVVPLHPRTIARMEAEQPADLRASLAKHPLLRLVPAVPFLDMIQLERHATIVLTDSGGVQKEAYFFRRPAVILLEETPWVELAESGSAVVTGSRPEAVIAAFRALLEKKDLQFPPVFGDGRAAYFICERLHAFLASRAH